MINFRTGTFTTQDPAETYSLGARFATYHLAPGNVLGLVGELGSGKTQFVKGIARGLGCTVEVTSPSFTLLHEYRGARVPLFHFDFYRIENASRLIEIDIDEYFSSDGVSVVEWADRFPELMPERTQWIGFRITGETMREIIGVN
jgi:tRNA threonylcarbamoyladenosine biosynthesis protein TsaE